MMPPSKLQNRVERSNEARKELALILNDEAHPLYLAKDIELSKKFKVSRHTIYHIRNEMETPSRKYRIIKVLRSIPTMNMTISEISKKLNLKYQNVYKILVEESIPFKEET